MLGVALFFSALLLSIAIPAIFFIVCFTVWHWLYPYICYPEMGFRESKRLHDLGWEEYWKRDAAVKRIRDAHRTMNIDACIHALNELKKKGGG